MDDENISDAIQHMQIRRWDMLVITTPSQISTFNF